MRTGRGLKEDGVKRRMACLCDVWRRRVEESEAGQGVLEGGSRSNEDGLPQ